jgi:hypothetical protein
MMNNADDATLTTQAAPRVDVYTIQTPGGLGNGNFEDFSGANLTFIGSGEGEIAQMLIYNRALTVDERVSLEMILEAYYGINPGH